MSGTRRKPGRLGQYVEGYRTWLEQQGYTPQTIRNMLTVLGHVGVWMSNKDICEADLNEDTMAAFLAARRAAGQWRVGGIRAMAPLLTYLRQAGVTPLAQPPQGELGVLLGGYRCWLVQERGLADNTVMRYQNTARRFLSQHAMSGDVLDPGKLSGQDVNTFLLRECGRVSAGSAKGRVAELRSVLRFLYLQGFTPSHLATAVPPVGGWRLASLPPTVTTAEVQLVLDSCDRGTDLGVRDYAIMMLLARLGLRSMEVALLELQDIDWRAGEIVIRGKTRRQDRMPLPKEVGDALVAYLSTRDCRMAGVRNVFVTCRAPHGPIRPALVGDVVERACLRAGLPRMGPHRMRHALAAELLRNGSGLVAISQVLRHQDLATTAVYAKVDLTALQMVAPPWPGAV